MALYDIKNPLTKCRIIVILTFFLMLSLLIDKYISLYVKNNLASFIFYFKNIELWSDFFTNKLSALFLIINFTGLLISSLYFKNIKWASFFLSGIIVLVCSAIITSYLKSYFGRIRPEYIFENGLEGAHYWFESSDSFPSGHSSYYFSLFFPPFYYFDKAKPVIIIPVSIALGRIIQKAHFLSDVVMSILIVVILTVTVDLTIRMLSKNLKLKAWT